jgi:hypothetical protein
MNKEYHRLYAAKWRKEHPERALATSRRNNAERKAKGYSAYRTGGGRDAFLRATYGITQSDFDRMKNEQNGVCYLCGQPETAMRAGKPRELCVDHNHLTGKVRHLLCLDCNFMVGHSRENPLVLERAAEMLRVENA